MDIDLGVRIKSFKLIRLLFVKSDEFINDLRKFVKFLQQISVQSILIF